MSCSNGNAESSCCSLSEAGKYDTPAYDTANAANADVFIFKLRSVGLQSAERLDYSVVDYHYVLIKIVKYKSGCRICTPDATAALNSKHNTVRTVGASAPDSVRLNIKLIL